MGFRGINISSFSDQSDGTFEFVPNVDIIRKHMSRLGVEFKRKLAVFSGQGIFERTYLDLLIDKPDEFYE